MKEKGTLDTILDTYIFVYFLKNILPFIALICMIFFGIYKLYSYNIRKQYDENITMFETSFEDNISEIAKKNLNKDELELEVYLLNSLYDINLNYEMKNKSHSLEEYKLIIKQEIDKLYNEIKNKKIINDSILATERETSEMNIKFTFSVNNTRSTILIDDYLKYNIQDKWDSGYNDLINKINEISQDDYDKIISSYQNMVENK